MSSRVVTAIPASRSTARSSAAVGLTRSIQTALFGRSERSSITAFFRADSVGTNTENMRGRTPKRHGRGAGPGELRDLSPLCQLANDSGVNHPRLFAAPGLAPVWLNRASVSQSAQKWDCRRRPCGRNATGSLPQRGSVLSMLELRRCSNDNAFTESWRLRRKGDALARFCLSDLSEEHDVVAESETRHSGLRSPPVGLHAGHDL